MSELKKTFEAAAASAKDLPEKPDNDTLLKLYALYKQGAIGDVSGERPGMFDFIAGAKFDAWESIKGTNQEAAMQQYVDLIESLKG